MRGSEINSLKFTSQKIKNHLFTLISFKSCILSVTRLLNALLGAATSPKNTVVFAFLFVNALGFYTKNHTHFENSVPLHIYKKYCPSWKSVLGVCLNGTV